MKSSFYEDSRLRASPRHGGAGSVYAFCLIFLLIRRGGAPSGAAVFITTIGDRCQLPNYAEKSDFPDELLRVY